MKHLLIQRRLMPVFFIVFMISIINDLRPLWAYTLPTVKSVIVIPVQIQGQAYPGFSVYYDKFNKPIQLVTYNSPSKIDNTLILPPYNVPSLGLRIVIPAYVMSFDQQRRLIARNEYNRCGKLTGYTTYSYFPNGKLQVERLFNANSVLQSTTTCHYDSNWNLAFKVVTDVDGYDAYYSAFGELICDIREILERLRISQEDFQKIKSNPGWAVPAILGNIQYQNFVTIAPTEREKKFLTRVIFKGLEFNQARMAELISGIDHIVMGSASFDMLGVAAPSAKTLILGYHQNMDLFSEQTIQWGLLLIVHEMAHVYAENVLDIHVLSSPARSEEYAYQEMLDWSKKLHLAQSEINRQQFIVDHIPDNNYDGIIARCVVGGTDPATGRLYDWERALAPFTAVANYLSRTFGIDSNELVYVRSTIQTLDHGGSITQGYAFTFSNRTNHYQIFSDMDGIWLNFNGQWLMDDLDRYLNQVMDPHNVTPGEFEIIQNNPNYINFGFSTMPYSTFTNLTVPAEYKAFLKEAIQLGSSIDKSRMMNILTNLNHLFFLYSPSAGQGSYPSFATSIGALITSFKPPEMTDSEQRRNFMLFLLAHEGRHLQDVKNGTGLPYPDWQSAAKGEYAAITEALYFTGTYLRDHMRQQYNSEKFTADRILDNNFVNNFARFVGADPSFLGGPMTLENYQTAYQRLMAPLLNSQDYICHTYRIDKNNLLYESSNPQLRNYNGMSIDGLRISFSYAGKQYVIYVDTLGELLNYNGHWIKFKRRGSSDLVKTTTILPPELESRINMESSAIQKRQSVPPTVRIVPEAPDTEKQQISLINS